MGGGGSSATASTDVSSGTMSAGVSSGSIRTLAQDAEMSQPRTLKVPGNRELLAIEGMSGAVMVWALKSEVGPSLDGSTLLLVLCVGILLILLLLCAGSEGI